MSTTTPRISATFIMVPCRCGRMLRAKWDQVGSEIVCWDCRATTQVVVPRDRLRLLEQLRRSIFDLFRQQQSMWIVGAGAALTLTLLIPGVGLALASLLLIGGAAAYGDQIQLWGERVGTAEPFLSRLRRQMTWSRWLACILFAAGTVLPLWVMNAGHHRSPHFNRISLPILALSWTILPVVMAVVFAEPTATNGKIRARLQFFKAHPLLAAAILAILPLSLVACEVAVGVVVYLEDLLPFFALDYMPIPGKPERFNGILFYGTMSYLEFPPEQFIKGYFWHLRHGYTLVGGIPPSLSVPTRAELNPEAYRLTVEGYYALRVGLVFAISVVLTLSSAIQARCLSVLVNAPRYRIG